ncbi:MAG: glycosyltransferase family 2 protein [Roseivirga sp.]|jgi:hypothetical protein|uniref:glycosyltransferase family 2 protein n=1 Tax=Roseivirga sp. TaxID=1964215 RepID=UPI001B18EC29|nr:glycosyltransferase family 2 protein [Roseivirga sp.]MBO6496697.1 glycosyltransferase family 2 protein [Roseivirga sp.]
MSLIPEISIIYVNYNSLNELRESISSVVKQTSIPFEILIVNNQPKEDLKVLCDLHSKIKVIELDHNAGFGKACNVGIKASQTDFVLLLNPDTLLLEDSISKCLQTYKKLDSKTTGLLSCGHYNDSEAFEYSSILRKNLPVFPFLRLPWKRLFYSAKGIYNLSKEIELRHQNSHYTYAIHGSFVLASKTLLIDFPFDEDFFLYGEEIDLCRRLNEAGKPSYFYACTSILHTSQRAKRNTSIRFQMHLSASLLVLKYYGRSGYALYYLLRITRSIPLAVLRYLLPNPMRIKVNSHLMDYRPFSTEHLRVFRYKRKINSLRPLKSKLLSA